MFSPKETRRTRQLSMEAVEKRELMAAERSREHIGQVQDPYSLQAGDHRLRSHHSCCS